MQRKNAELDLRGLTLVVVAGAWLAGMLLAAAFPLPALALLIGAMGALLCIIPLWRDRWGRLIMLMILWLLLGAWRYSIASPVGDPQAISAFLGTRTVQLRGTVADEPKLSGRTRLLLIEVSSVSRNNGASWQDAHGRLEVQTLDSSLEDPYGPNYGDNVELQGKLQAPSPHSSPGIFANMAFPRISGSSTGGNPIIAALYHLRITLATIILQSLPQPEAALLVAILLGLRLPALKPLIPAFNETGTAHLIAPSGFKVTLLAGLVTAGTKWLYEVKNGPKTKMLPAQKRRGEGRRWMATALVLGSIVTYTLLNGAGPAALRAGIMGVLLVVAPRFGRTYNIYTALALTALLMSLFDPFVLWDAGFQLSFLGTVGIVLLTPFFQRWLHFLERLPLGHVLAEISAVTLAAQTATLPIFALTFSQISFIAPIANVLTFPLLATLIFLGILVCSTGLLFAPIGILCGWIVWPLLWYISTIISWCAMLPGAYISVGAINSGLAWGYYGLLTLVVSTILYKWPKQKTPTNVQTLFPFLSQRTWRIVQCCAALLVLLATGATALAAQPDGRLTVTFFNVGPMGQLSQGEAIFISTPDGKTALIDGGLDATSLGQALDARLPFWQRSLDVVLLTTPKSDHLTGLQDIVTRYQVGEVLDGGMLHPSAGYALFRRTITERNLHYTQVRQGATIPLGSQVSLQVFWPPLALHKSSTETQDNALIVQLVAPGLSVLLLGATAFSKYALTKLMTDILPSYLKADIVQVVSEGDKAFPTELSAVLQAAHPSLLLITPAALSPKQRKAGISSTITPTGPLVSSNWQVVQTSQMGTTEISTRENGWHINTE